MTQYALIVACLLYLLSPFPGKWFYENELRWLYVLLLSFCVCAALVPPVRQLAFRFKLFDKPDKRKLHKKPIPRIGGLAIFAAIIITFIRNFRFQPELIAVLLATTVIFVVEFMDDIKPSSAFLRLFGQLVAASIIVLSGITISILPAWVPGKNIIEALITILWIIGITNAFNFLDGMDGLASGLAIVSGFCFFMIAWPTQQHETGYIIVALIGVASAFLFYNFKPASIFLGDAGATVLGFLLSVFAVIGSYDTGNAVVAAVIPILILGIPIFDMVYITISRVRNGSVKNVKEWIEFTGKDNFHHRLLNIGLNEKQSVGFLYALNLCLGLGAIAMRDAGRYEAMLLAIQALIIFGIIVVLMLVGRELS